MQNDSVLYDEFLAGNTSSFDQLMIRYGDNLMYYLYGYVHNLEDAEDLMIEAFARIMAKKPSISEGSFKAYLFRTGRNLAARFHLIKSRMNVFSMDSLPVELSDHKSVETELLNEEKKRILHLCLERIDPEVREAIWLVYFEEMSYAAAGEVMGVKTKRIDKLLTRGKKLLREELLKEGITDAH